MTVSISAEQRDALYDQLIDRLSAIEDIWIAASGGDFKTADRLAREFADELRLLCDDLGWGEGHGEAVVLSSPPELLRRVFTRFERRAEEMRHFDRRQEAEVEALQRRSAILAETCRQGLAELEGEAP